MKNPLFFVVFGVFLAAWALVSLVSTSEDGETKGSSNGSSGAERAQVVSHLSSAEQCLCSSCRSQGQSAVSSSSSPRIKLDPEPFVAGLAHSGSRVSIPLPGGEKLPATVTRRQFSPEGELLAVEGTVSLPAPGRFLFSKQAEGLEPGPLWGLIYYPSLETGWGIETTEAGTFLVEKPSDVLACREYDPVVDQHEDPQEIPADHPTDLPIPDYQNGIIPLESLPGATGVLYLDFDGQEGPHSGWGDFDAVGFNVNSNDVFIVWQRVAEDFAPFNLNVTTDLAVFEAAPATSRQRCIITPTKNAAPGAGGVAYIGSFNSSSDTPCWAYYGKGKSAAEVISHELGHTLRLTHDGTASSSYYGGHGSGVTRWGPIMGVSYGPNLSQWSKGEYAGANNQQDDFDRIISTNNNVAYRPDDHGGTHGAASELIFDRDGNIDDEGNIETDGDVDAFHFTTTGGTVSINIDPVALGPNLDIAASLHDVRGDLIISSNPVEALDANLSATLAGGSYTIRVTNTGKGDVLGTGYSSYGSRGQYTIGGTIPGVALPDSFDLVENSAPGTLLGIVSPRGSHGSNPLTYEISSGDPDGLLSIDNTGILRVTGEIDYEGLAMSMGQPVLLELEVRIIDTIDSSLNENLLVVVEILDINEPPVLTEQDLIILEHTRVGRSLLQLSSGDPDADDGPSWAITGGDPQNRFGIDQEGRLFQAAELTVTADTTYELTVAVTDSGNLSDSTSVTIEVLDVNGSHEAGGIGHAFYNAIPGNTLAALTGSGIFPRDADVLDYRDEIHAQGDGDNYGRAIRGFLIPPHDGSYRFWLAGDHAGELRISPSDDPGSLPAVPLASHSAGTGYQEWTKYSSQTSSQQLSLLAGQPYYFEILQKEDSGVDHLSLAWEIRDSGGGVLQSRQPVPGLYIAPHEFNYRPSLAQTAFQLREDAYPFFRLGSLTLDDLNTGDSPSGFETTSSLFSIENSGLLRVTRPDLLPAVGTVLEVEVTVTDSGVPPLSATETIEVEILSGTDSFGASLEREIWHEITGNAISSLLNDPRFPDTPDETQELTSLDTGINYADNYGSRLRGLIIPPESGDYTFYLAGDDETRFSLSSDSLPSNASVAASISGWTGAGQWDKYVSQRSASRSLVAGQAYYFEVLHKEGGGGDHFSVGWTTPSNSSITVIPASAVTGLDPNLPPVLSAGSSASLLAGATSLSLPFTVSDDPSDVFTYQILSSDGPFTINPDTGVLTVSDGATPSPGTVFLTIGVQDSGMGGRFPLQESLRELAVIVEDYEDDLDQDLLTDSWELAIFGNIWASAPGRDSDRDGFADGFEYLFNGDPSSAASLPSLPAPNGLSSGTPGDHRFQFTWTLRNNVSPALWKLQRSSDLATWSDIPHYSWTVLASEPAGPNHQRQTIEITSPEPHIFLRVVIP